MDSFLRKTLLIDFYGELLTETQRNIFEMHFMYDLSLSEIAEKRGVSPQGVRDVLVRTEKNLEDYDSKLSLIDSHFTNVERISSKCDELEQLVRPHLSESDFMRASSLLRELKELDGCY